MNYRRNILLASIAPLVLVAGVTLAAAQEPAKEKAPQAAPPHPAAQPMSKTPAAAEQPKAGAPNQRVEENQRMGKPGNTAAEESKPETQKPNATAQRGNEKMSAKSSAAANVKLSAEQRTRIKGIVMAGHGGPRVTHVNFDVRIGVIIPRGSVEYVPVPETLVQIEPVWQGFYYFVYGDELVIVDPDTLAIVAVIPV